MYKIIIIEEIAYGWLTLKIGKMHVSCSDFRDYDFLQKFLEKIIRILNQKSVREWVWCMHEPGATVLQISKENQKMIFQHYGLSVDSFKLPKENETSSGVEVKELISEEKIPVSDLLDYLVTEFSLYELGNGRKIYENNWFPFPQKEYEILRQKAIEINSIKGEFEELFCMTFLQEE